MSSTQFFVKCEPIGPKQPNFIINLRLDRTKIEKNYAIKTAKQKIAMLCNGILQAYHIVKQSELYQDKIHQGYKPLIVCSWCEYAVFETSLEKNSKIVDVSVRKLLLAELQKITESRLDLKIVTGGLLESKTSSLEHLLKIKENHSYLSHFSKDSELQNNLKSLEAAITAGKPCLTIKNKSYVIGDQKHSLVKKAPFREHEPFGLHLYKRGSNDNIYNPGSKPLKEFELNGHRCIVTICREHVVLPLHPDFKQHKNADIEFLTSATITIQPEHMRARELIHFDSNHATTHIVNTKDLISESNNHVYEYDLFGGQICKIVPYFPSFFQLNDLINHSVLTPHLPLNVIKPLYDKIHSLYQKLIDIVSYTKSIATLDSMLEEEGLLAVRFILYEVRNALLQDAGILIGYENQNLLLKTFDSKPILLSLLEDSLNHPHHELIQYGLKLGFDLDTIVDLDGTTYKEKLAQLNIVHTEGDSAPAAKRRRA